MKAVRVVVVILIVAGLFPLAPPALAADPDVVFEGHGWGHAVGMTQYGAKSLAQLAVCPPSVSESGAPCTAQEIVEYYYTDSEVVDVASPGLLPQFLLDDASPLWINLVGSSSATPQFASFKSTGGGLTFCQQEPDSVGTLSQANNGAAWSAYVELLQQRLLDLGYDPGPVDGWFGPLTEQAVIDFQTDQSLSPVDGAAGEATKNALWETESGDRCVIETQLSSTSYKKLVPNASGSECQLGTSLEGACRGSVRGLSVADRLVIKERTVRDGNPIQLAHGSLRVRPDLDSTTTSFEGIHLVLEVGIDDYVRGIDEIIYGWHTVANEALKAQAIASRSYGLWNAKSLGPASGFSASRQDYCFCHLWSSTASQVYAGYYAETAAGGVWDAAVEDTLGQVLEHPTWGLVDAFFSSSSGGATQNNEDVWGPAIYPYLRSVPDPWSLDTSAPYPNPFANWSYSFSPASVAGMTGLDELGSVQVVETFVSGAAKTVRFSGSIGGSEAAVDKTGSWVKSSFGLRSIYFNVDWESVEEPPPPPPPPPPPEPAFDDISGNIFEQAINWLASEGITKGCNPPENSLFCPDRKVTRGEMAVFISRAMDLPAAVEDHFTDDSGKFYEGAANRLYEAGITTGCAPGLYCGEQWLPREQMAALMSRALGLPDTLTDYFVDDDGSIYEHWINEIAEARITLGCNPPTNDRFCPAGTVTRAQMAGFFKRAWGP